MARDYNGPGGRPPEATLPPGRAQPVLSRLLRAASGPGHVDGAGDERRLRLHVDADQAAWRGEARFPRLRFLPGVTDGSLGDVRRLQGWTASDIRRDTA